jgi:hypothetical protein
MTGNPVTFHLTYCLACAAVGDLENDGRICKRNQIMISFVAALPDLVSLLYHIYTASDTYSGQVDGWTDEGREGCLYERRVMLGKSLLHCCCCLIRI